MDNGLLGIQGNQSVGSLVLQRRVMGTWVVMVEYINGWILETW